MRIQAIIWKEDDTYIIKEPFTGVTTQGKTIEMALQNLKEAVELYLEEVPEVAEQLEKTTNVGALNVEIAPAVRQRDHQDPRRALRLQSL